jgi:acyl-CoA synthetase (AMP-forming)/AMP-acid ligase II
VTDRTSGTTSDLDRPAVPAPLPIPATLWDLVVDRSEISPDAPMLNDERGRTLTFRQYRSAAEEVAAGLAALGVHAGTVVSWQLPTSIEAMVLLAALARLGAVQNPIIPVLRDREVRFITRQAGAELFVVPGVFRNVDYGAMAERIAGEIGFAVHVTGLAGDPASAHGSFGLSLPAGDPTTLPPPPVGDRGLTTWIYYTSGTTADPKGARHSDLSVMATSNGACEVGGFGPDDVSIAASPTTHIGGVMLLTVGLRSGCRHAVVDTWDPVRTPLFASRQGITVLRGAGPMLGVYIEAQRTHGEEPLFPDLRYCLSGGAPLPPGTSEDARDVLGGLGALSSWGLTEFAVATCPPPDRPEMVHVGVGPVVPHVSLRVVGPDGRDCGIGEEGELCAKGPQLMLGYVDPSLDVDAFDEHGYFRTGDLGLIDEQGYVHVTGRLKEIIIRNGENISARQVELALLEHPGIADCAVIGLPDDHTGERCVAVIAPTDDRADSPLTLAEVAAHCRAEGLAVFKTPEQLEIVDEIPRNDLGKAQKPALKARFTAP